MYHDGLTMDVPRGSRRTRHAASTASSQEAQLQAQAQLELEAATHHRRSHPRRQAVQVQVTPDAALAVAAGAHQTPESSNNGNTSNHGRRREMEPPPNPFRLHRCELLYFGSFWCILVYFYNASPHFLYFCPLMHPSFEAFEVRWGAKCFDVQESRSCWI